ncbi:MAG: ComEA family DNA-binding protein [Candidatus Dormibacteria bacterium]
MRNKEVAEVLSRLGQSRWRVALPLAILGLMAASAAAVTLKSRPGGDLSLAAATSLAPPPARGLLVHVIGAVAAPGLYRVQSGERVLDLVALAGGLLDSADRAHLPNLAARLRDGQQLKVPFLTSGRATRVSLNSASLAELETVPGIDPDLARAIVDFRDNFGGFQAVKDLVTVLGMDPASYAVAHLHLSL